MKVLLNIIQYSFLFFVLFISIIITLIFAPLFVVLLFTGKILCFLSSILFFIPAILIIYVFFTAKKYKGKNSTLLKFLSYILILFILCYVQPFLSAIPFLVCEYYTKNDSYNPVRPVSEYKYFTRSIDYRTLHFPKAIPDNATGIELFVGDHFFGAVEKYLKFNINSDYINNELKKYNFKKIETDANYKGIHIRETVREKDDIYYIIEDNLSGSPGKFTYAYGIVVNKKSNKIIYYYSKFD